MQYIVGVMGFMCKCGNSNSTPGLLPNDAVNPISLKLGVESFCIKGSFIIHEVRGEGRPPGQVWGHYVRVVPGHIVVTKVVRHNQYNIGRRSGGKRQEQQGQQFGRCHPFY